jgi:hypothetical protein
MPEYHHFAAVFTTTLIREDFRKVIVDPVKIEFFKGSIRTLSIPAVTGRIFPAGIESTILTPIKLQFQPENYYILITARSDVPDVSVAVKKCSDMVDREITDLSLLYRPHIFDRPVYRGPVIEENIMSAAFYTRLENPIQLEPAKITADIAAMRKVRGSDIDLQRRYGLMARFFSKAVALDPSEEKFLFLWTVLEVFPMKDTSNVRPLKEFVARLLGRSADEIDKRLLIGRTHGLRSDLVHNGKLELTAEELAKLIDRLENICIEVLRSISGLSYSGLLNQYFT